MIKKQSFWQRTAGGFFIGLGLVIPGVSGSILAMSLGLYEPIVGAIAKPFANWRQNLQLLTPLALGAGSCLLILSRVLHYLFNHYPMLVLYFFLGLVLGYLPTLWREITTSGFRLSFLVQSVLGALSFFCLLRLPLFFVSGLLLPKGFFGEILLGLLLGATLVVPGVSASFLLLVLGAYGKVLGAMANLDLTVLIPLGIGAFLTVILTAKIISALLKQHYSSTLAFISGILLVSLWLARPGLPRTGLEFVLCFLLGILGIVFSLLFNSKQADTRR